MFSTTWQNEQLYLTVSSHLPKHDLFGYVRFPLAMSKYICEYNDVEMLYSLIIWFFEVAKFTILMPLSTLSGCTLSFPIVGINLFTHFALTLKIPYRICIWYTGNWMKSLYFFIKVIKYSVSSLSSDGACTRTFTTILLYHQSFSIIQHW